MLAVVNYGVGNLRSVVAALRHLDRMPVRVVESGESLEGYRGLVIPGVGAFSVGSARLYTPAFKDELTRFLDSGRKALGICLGMQLMFEWGVEGDSCAGLGLVKGTVEALEAQPNERLPNMGWRVIRVAGAHPVFRGVDRGATFYFCHSYHGVASDSADVAAVSAYGESEFVAAVARGSALGVQFHPEKSGRHGLSLLRNFCEWCDE